ncbi:MAG: thiamine ABC transporter substrate binding subunit [Pseudomonadota bacterium]
MLRLLTVVFAVLMAVALPASAKDKLTIYTYDSFTSDWGPGPKIKASFEATCKCELEWVAVADAVATLNRIKLEGASSKADILLGIDTSLTAEAEATGLFEQHGISTENVNLPVQWTNKTFVPYDYGHFAVIYDSEKVKTPPASLDDLVNGDPEQKIVIQDPRTSSPGLGLLLWIKAIYGDKAGEAWTKLSRRVLTVTPGWSEAYGMFTKGEAPMVLSYTTSPAYHMVSESTDRYRAAGFPEGHYMQIEVAGILKSSQNKKLAREFLAFMTGPGFQDHIPTNNWMWPAGKTSDALPDAFGKLVKPAKSLLLSADEVNANRKAWIDEWLKATTR